MGREVKRVAANFDWPQQKIWWGYLTPKELHPKECVICERSGYNMATAQIAKEFPKWCDKLTQDEVDKLAAAGELRYYTHNFESGKGWQEKNPPVKILAEALNRNTREHKGRPGGGVDRYILIKTRAEKLGVWGECRYCKGDGHVFHSKAQEEAYENFQKIEPPKGEWWQIWETVSEGSPVTPAFATKEELINHLVEGGDAWDRKCRAEG